jgi:multiple antibiotic resistance protein
LRTSAVRLVQTITNEGSGDSHDDRPMSKNDLGFILIAFPAILVVVDPFAAIPIFAAMTAGDAVEKRRAMAGRAALATGITLAFFALSGGVIFKVLGISLPAFKIAGGVMILLMALDMMRAQPSRTRSTAAEQAEAMEKDDVAIVPLAIPMLAGPGAIATVAVLMTRAGWRPLPTLAIFVSIALTSTISWLLLRAAASAERFLSRTTLRILERLMGLLLAAVAVEFMAGGVTEFLLRARPS